MTVLEQKFSSVFKIAIDDLDHRLSKVCQSSQEFLLHAEPISIHDFITPAFGVVGVRKEFMLVTKLFVEKSVNERDVVMNSPSLENLLASQPQMTIPVFLRLPIVAFLIVFAEFALVPALFYVFPEFEAQLVRVDLARMHRNSS